MATVDYALLEELLGEEIGPEFIHKLSKVSLSIDEQQTLAWRVSHAFAPTRTLHIPSAVLAPYLPMRIHPPSKHGHPGGINLYAGSFFKPQIMEATNEHLRRHLLYCHNVVIDNPFGVVFSMTRHPSRANAPEVTLALVNLFIFLMEWRQPIERGILQFYDPVWNVDNHPIFDAYQELVAAESYEAPRTEFELACFELLETVFAANETMSRLTAYLPNDVYREALREVVGRSMRPGLAWWGESENIKIARLLHSEIPDTSHLTSRDIVSIRDGHEGFDRWRRVLGFVLEVAAKTSEDAIDPPAAELEFWERELGALASQLGRSLRGRVRPSDTIEEMGQFALGSILGTLDAKSIPWKSLTQLQRGLMRFLLPFKYGEHGDPLLAHYMSFGSARSRL